MSISKFLNNNKKKRIYSFDFLKYIAIFIIFVYHICTDMYLFHPMRNLEIVFGLIVRPDRTYQNIHMAMVACAIFIFISGATIAINYRNENLLDFYKKRILKLLIPFYIVYIGWIFVRIINARSFNAFPEFENIESWRFIYTIIGLDQYLASFGVKTFAIGAGEWFLGCIILCYVAFPFLYKADKKSPKLIFICMTLFSLFINIFYGKFGFGETSHINFLCQVYNFYLGIAIINNKLLDKIDKRIVLPSIFAILILYFNKIYIKLIPNNYLVTIFVLASVIIVYYFEKNIQKNKTLVNFLTGFSKISLEVFLVHHLVIYEIDLIFRYKRLGFILFSIAIILDVLLTLLLAKILKLISWKFYSLVYQTHDKRKNNTKRSKKKNRK